MNINMNVSPKDLVWYNEGGDIQSGGYSVDSLFKTLGISPIISDNLNVMTGGGKEGKNVERFSELFDSTAVPAGLSLLGGSNDLKGSTSETNLGSGSVSGFDVQYGGEGMISESLFDKLTKLISPDNNDNDNNDNNKEKRENKTHKKKAHRQTKKKGNKNNKISKPSNTTSKNRKTKRKNK
jgi:hypothetical protein